MVWMFDKQNVKIRNTDSRIKQHLMQKSSQKLPSQNIKENRI